MILPTNLTAEEIYGAAAARLARDRTRCSPFRSGPTVTAGSRKAHPQSTDAGARSVRPTCARSWTTSRPSSLIERVAFLKGAQIGGTECGNNWMGTSSTKLPAR